MQTTFKFFLPFFLFCLMLPFGGCGKPVDSSSPSAIVKKYFAALHQGDVEAVREITTPHWCSTITNPIAMGAARTARKERGGIKSCSSTIDGDFAIVHVTFEKKSDVYKDVYAGLAKVDGKWIIETVVPEVHKDILLKIQADRAEKNKTEESSEPSPGAEQ